MIKRYYIGFATDTKGTANFNLALCNVCYDAMVTYMKNTGRAIIAEESVDPGKKCDSFLLGDPTDCENYGTKGIDTGGEAADTGVVGQV